MASSSGETLVLPAGAIPISVMTMNASTGGTNPTIDIGGTPAGGSNARMACSMKLIVTVKALLRALTARLQLLVVCQPIPPLRHGFRTGGTWTGILTYAMSNDGVE